MTAMAYKAVSDTILHINKHFIDITSNVLVLIISSKAWKENLSLLLWNKTSFNVLFHKYTSRKFPSFTFESSIKSQYKDFTTQRPDRFEAEANLSAQLSVITTKEGQ